MRIPVLNVVLINQIMLSFEYRTTSFTAVSPFSTLQTQPAMRRLMLASFLGVTLCQEQLSQEGRG